MSDTRLVMVPFYGEHIAAYQAADGTVSAHLKWLCGRLGVAYPPQFRKVTGGEYRWHHRVLTLAGDDRRRRCVLIGVECLPTWLLSIHVRKVSPEVGRKLILFQREAQQVLADYFFGRCRSPVPPALPLGALPAPPTPFTREAILDAVAIARRLTSSAEPDAPTRRV